MISIDLSKTPSLRILVYLLGLFPGLFFLSSVAIGNPQLAKAIIGQVKEVYSFPPFGLSLILLGAGLFIGQAFVLLSWILEMTFYSLYRLLRALFIKSFPNLFGGRKLNKWFAEHQGTPPERSLAIRVLGKLIFLARATPDIPPDTQEARAVRGCLGAATEKLLERRYGIDALRASGSCKGEWNIWYSFLGTPNKYLIESRNAGRILLACGLAGFLALGFAPRLDERYFLALSSVFAFSGLWTAGWFLFKGRNTVWQDAAHLRAILQELQDWTHMEANLHNVKSEPTGKRTP